MNHHYMWWVLNPVPQELETQRDEATCPGCKASKEQSQNLDPDNSGPDRALSLPTMQCCFPRTAMCMLGLSALAAL